MGLVRKLNEGVPRVFSVMEDAVLPEPEIIETAANVTVVLRNGKTATDNPQTTENAAQTTTQRILELMENEPEISIEAIAAHIGITRNGVNYQNKKMKSHGPIERVGGDFVGQETNNFSCPLSTASIRHLLHFAEGAAAKSQDLFAAAIT